METNNKGRYWANIAISMRPEIKALGKAGILEKGESSFRNVGMHSLLQVGIHEILGALDGSTSNEIKDQKITALLHDDRKRKDKKGDITKEQWAEYMNLRDKLQPNDNFIRAESGVSNHIDILVDELELDYQTKKAWYVDNIAGKSEVIDKGENILVEDVVAIDKRIDELKVRNPDHGKDIPVETVRKMEATLKNKYDWNKLYDYWEVERMLIKKVEKEIFDILRGNGVEIARPEDIPMHIKTVMENDYRKYNNT